MTFWKKKQKISKRNQDTPIGSNEELTSNNLHKIFESNEDIVFQNFEINNINMTVIYVDGLVDKNSAGDYILKPLKQGDRFKHVMCEKDIIKLILEGDIYFAEQKARYNINETINDLLNGKTVIVFDREKTALTFNNIKFDKRSVTEPTGENAVKGGKDAFVESIRTNTATVRRRIKTRSLKIESMTIGKRTCTQVDVVYINDIADKEIVNEVKKRLETIDIDGVLTTGSIEDYIVDHKYTVFPQIVYTERPDKFCSDIIEGRVGLIVDGLPVTFIVPATFLQFMQAPEDYSNNYIVGSVIRLLRFVLLAITLILPGLYTSITTFHQEMIPSELAMSIQSSKEGVPFPSFVEVLFMLIAFEILIEAGFRLPRTIGQTITIVGAVIVGQAAVNAKLVSPAIVVVISITAIASFVIPNQDFSNAIRIWRFIFVIFSSVLGLFGLSIGFLAFLLMLSVMEVFGVPYMAPFAAGKGIHIQDSIFRFRFPNFKKRPLNLKTQDNKRR